MFGWAGWEKRNAPNKGANETKPRRDNKSIDTSELPLSLTACGRASEIDFRK
jgi:hypothetical protein